MSEVGDHVIAREFFPKENREGIPKVPACKSCNSSKSELETELTAVLAFGSRSDSGRQVLIEDIPRRLAKNNRLARELNFLAELRWDEAESGLITPNLNLPIDEKKLEKLFALIATGLIFDRFDVLIPPEYSVHVAAITEEAESSIKSKFFPDLNGVVWGDIGSGAFQYVGRQGVDYPQLSIWLMRFYTGVTFSDRNSSQRSSSFLACSGKRDLFQRPAISNLFSGAT
jgi:hypothetical protein